MASILGFNKTNLEYHVWINLLQVSVFFQEPLVVMRVSVIDPLEATEVCFMWDVNPQLSAFVTEPVKQCDHFHPVIAVQEGIHSGVLFKFCDGL